MDDVGYKYVMNMITLQRNSQTNIFLEIPRNHKKLSGRLNSPNSRSILRNSS